MPEAPLAHSRRGDVPAQTYVEHVASVRREAGCKARRASAFYTGDRDRFIAWVDAAALYHDFGKLDEANQAVLRRDTRDPLPVAHEDAGVAELDRLRRQEPVVLVAGHHAGLFSRAGEFAKQGRPFRELARTTPTGVPVADHVDQDGRLNEYRGTHRRAGCPELLPVEPEVLHACGFTRRVALSCLVDADHGDTAHHYGGEVETSTVDLRWEERAEALQRYVNSLLQGKTDRQRRRNQLRRRVFEACRDAPIEPGIRACGAPVGSGKTTAVMAHLLRIAHEKRLRHIFVVLPFTNIITQSVEVYRKALALEGERAEDVVAEHHHRADFGDLELRQLATLWRAPIIVTTAVQFFETLGTHHPARLRKLHELPGSAVFVDEAHAAVPSHLWPQVWRWLETWTRDWGGHLVLGSGSLPRFWELDEYASLIHSGSAEPMPAVPDLVSDDSLRSELQQVRFRRRSQSAPALDCPGLVDFLVQKDAHGPRLLIVNTVQTAAVLANAMREAKHDVLHLSTALAPAHRDLVVQRIKLRLRDRIQDWTLIATSCVEAGMDFSFRTGFRERATTASLIQIGGRINRGDENEDAEVWDLLLRDDRFTSNPALTVSRTALGRFTEEELNCPRRSDLATSAMRREWTAGAEKEARRLVAAEDQMEYPEVEKLSRVIATDTRTVIVCPSLAQSICQHRRVSQTELLRYSVQLWATKIESLGLESVYPGADLYVWNDTYDPEFLGIMAGVLRNQQFLRERGAVI